MSEESYHPVRKNGFSLIEITMAIGIFAVCGICLVYLLGVALDSTRQSQIDSALAGVLRNMDSELRSLSYSNTNAAGVSLVNATSKTFYFDSVGNLVSNASSAIYRVNLERVADVSGLTAVTNGQHVSPGVSDSVGHYLWMMTVSYPPPSYPKSSSFLLGRTLQGSGTWAVSGTTYRFYE